jgi:tetratricopeptide (TPR) repeat protein
VFVGGWTVAAAEAISQDLLDAIPASANLLDDLAALLDASLIIESTDSAGTPRCTMLETIHEYAYAQLVAHGELQLAHELHMRYFATFATQAAPELSGPAQLMWLQRCDDERGNLRAALSWCGEHAIGVGLRLASDIHRFWVTRGYRREGRDWLESLLNRVVEPDDSAPSSEERAYGLLISGMHSMFLHEAELATRRLHESLGLYQQLEDHQQIAWVFNNLGNVALQQGAYTEAEQHYQKSVALRRKLNDTAGIAACMNNLGEVARAQGDPHTARTYYDESLSLYRQVGDRSMAASVMGHIATMLVQQGDYSEAHHLFEESHAIAQEFGNKPGIWQTLKGLGNVARMQRRYSEAKQYYCQSLLLSAEIQNVGAVTLGLFCLAAVAWGEHRAEHAAMILGAAAALNESEQITHDPEDIEEFEEHVAAVRAALQATAFERAWAAGQRLSLEQAVRLALDEVVR